MDKIIINGKSYYVIEAEKVEEIKNFIDQVLFHDPHNYIPKRLKDILEGRE